MASTWLSYNREREREREGERVREREREKKMREIKAGNKVFAGWRI